MHCGLTSLEKIPPNEEHTRAWHRPIIWDANAHDAYPSTEWQEIPLRKLLRQQQQVADPVQKQEGLKEVWIMGKVNYGKGRCLQLAIAWLNKVLGEEADYGLAHACLWDRVSFTYGGLCSHSPLLEEVHGDLSLSAEELESIAQAVLIPNREQRTANGRRRRANPDALPGSRQRQRAVWERSMIQVRERYRINVAERNFYCATCNVAA